MGARLNIVPAPMKNNILSIERIDGEKLEKSTGNDIFTFIVFGKKAEHNTISYAVMHVI